MTTMSKVPDDHPLMIAWNEYKAGPDFENTKQWATAPKHTEGSLWAAFMAGWYKAVALQAQPADENSPQSVNPAAVPVRVTWGEFWIEQGDWETANDYAAFEKAERWLLAQQPTIGEEIMVNAAHDVYTLQLQPSGLSSGPRFVVHVPPPEPQAAQPAASSEPREVEVDMNEYRAMVAAMEQIDPATLPGLTTAQRCALGRFAKPRTTPVVAGDAQKADAPAASHLQSANCEQDASQVALEMQFRFGRYAIRELIPRVNLKEAKDMESVINQAVMNCVHEMLPCVRKELSD